MKYFSIFIYETKLKISFYHLISKSSSSPSKSSMFFGWSVMISSSKTRKSNANYLIHSLPDCRKLLLKKERFRSGFFTWNFATPQNMLRRPLEKIFRIFFVIFGRRVYPICCQHVIKIFYKKKFWVQLTFQVHLKCWRVLWNYSLVRFSNVMWS